MTISTPWNLTVRPERFVLCLLLLVVLGPAAWADDANASTDALLENLKQRTAEERWDRIKKQYQTNSANSRRTKPAQLPVDGQPVQDGFQAPPSPSQTSLIPRIESIPTDRSNDWLIPARELPADDEKLSAEQQEKVGDEVKKETPAPAAPVRVAAQEAPTPQPNAEQADVAPAQRALHERKINDINPYYDRERDGDIRQFALDKGRELDIEFKPKPYAPRAFPEIVMPWEVSNFTHRPLYFNDTALERYGHSYHPLIQPVASIARVGTQFVFWPYQATITPINKEESTLGWYRPGDVIPKLLYQVPLNAQAAAVEAGAVTGMYFFIVP